MAFTLNSGARHSLRPTPTGETSNDAAGCARCYGPLSRSPTRAFDAGLDPTRRTDPDRRRVRIEQPDLEAILHRHATGLASRCAASRRWSGSGRTTTGSPSRSGPPAAGGNSAHGTSSAATARAATPRARGIRLCRHRRDRHRSDGSGRHGGPGEAAARISLRAHGVYVHGLGGEPDVHSGVRRPAAAGRAAHRRGIAGRHPAGERHRCHDHHDVVRHPLDRHPAAGDHVPDRPGPAGRGRGPRVRTGRRPGLNVVIVDAATSAGSSRPWCAAGSARTSSTRTPPNGIRSRRACCRTPGPRSP
jgi:hypothetical protein